MGHRERDRRRSAEADAWRRLYSLQAWRRPVTGLRAQQLRREPRCERHLTRGVLVPASVVNHRLPHKGNLALFRDPANLESLCGPCHDGEVQSEERGRPREAVGEDGWPA